MGDIIKFPTNLTEPVKQQIDDAYVKLMNKAFVEEYVDNVGHALAAELHKHGFDVDNDTFILRYMYIMESLKAVMQDQLEVEHPLTEQLGKHAEQYFKDE